MLLELVDEALSSFLPLQIGAGLLAVGVPGLGGGGEVCPVVNKNIEWSWNTLTL